MTCTNPNCNCKHSESNTGGGFALGVAIGAATAVLLAPDEGRKMRNKARKKLDELVGDRTPEEMLDAIKEVASKVVDDIRDSAGAGMAEADKTSEKVMEGKHPITKSENRKR